LVHRVLAVAAIVLGMAAAVVDARHPSSVPAGAAQPDYVSAPELATWIMRGESSLHVFDVRSAADYERFHIPTATHGTLETLASESLPSPSRIVVYADDGPSAARAWALLRARGYDARVLREGLYEWIARVHEPRLADDATVAERESFEGAAEMSRYFGGLARSGVPRSEVPSGYWTGASRQTHAGAGALVAGLRRRGC
jgi:rhodanese-related sulfurtransferase